MNIADPLGMPGAPLETLQALTNRFKESDLQGAKLIMLTDRQGDRLHAQYAALVVTAAQQEAVLSAPAFGPRFGATGLQALADLTHWASSHALPIRETILNTPNFNRVVGEPDEQEVAALIAASNPSDAGIYTKLPPKQADD